MIRYSSILFPLIAFSCEKEVHLDKESNAPRIVVNGVLDPELPIEIEVSESASVLTGNFNMPILQSAKAFLFDSDQNLLGEFQHDTLGVYTLPDINVVAESTYYIKVTCPGFTDVFSKTTVPKAPTDIALDMQLKDDFIEYNLSFKDNGTATNFYWISIRQMKITANAPYGFSRLNRTICSENIAVENQTGLTETTNCDYFLFFSDKTFNGNTFHISFNQYNAKQANDTVVSLINFKSVSDDYYKYLITHDAYASHLSDPFAVPGQVHTNIENGFGIFAGSNSYLDTIYW